MPNYSAPSQAPAQITCTRCSSLFGRKYEYDRHIADVHAPKCVCRYCGKQISSRKDKKRDHLRHKHKISWKGEPDSHEELFLDQHYFRGSGTSPISSASEPGSSPLSPPPFIASRSHSHSLRMPEYPVPMNIPNDSNDQSWQVLQQQILSPRGDFLGSSNNAAGYMQDTSGYSFQATMGEYGTQGVAPMQAMNPISSVPRSSASSSTFPSHSLGTFSSPLDPSPDLQDFGAASEWFPSGANSNNDWNQYHPQ